MSKADQLRRMGGSQPTLALAEPDAYSDDGFQPAVGRTMKARPISILDILPDPAQPRRAVPSAARAAWDGKATADSIANMFNAWVELAEHELGEPLDLYVAKDPPEDFKRIEVEEETTPIAFKILKLVDLANDIFLNGLNEPIHIVAQEEGYRAESGERRWLAHWLLHLFTRDEKWTKINAFVRDDFSVWRQASENGAREKLNAIQLARQLSRLLMDIYQRDGVTFDSYAEALRKGGSDRAYYAQVADGEAYRIPRGWGEKIVAAMGLSHTQQLRQIRALLRLPDEIWVQGDDQSWTERTLRPYTVATATVSGSPKPTARDLTADEKRVNSDFRTMLAGLRQNGEVNAHNLERIEAFCKHLRETGRVFTPKELK